MRGGEGVGLPGYDGIVEATRSTAFVPEGVSVWEMGTSDDPAGKATEDYKTRSANSLGIDMATTTFVFVTPRRWRGKKNWEQKRRDEGKWRDVRALDADDIEQALEESAAVRIWMSELLDMPALGVATIEDWWRRFASGFDPRLTSRVVLAGREDSAAELLRRLAVDIGQTFIGAASVDDGLAFAACAMMAQDADASEPMLSRSLLVHDGATLRRLDGTSSLLILLPYEEHLQREANLIENHHVVFVVTDGDADIELPPLDHLTLRVALKDVGVLEENLDRFVRAGTKSLLALQRVARRFGQIDPEQWAQDLANPAIRRAWLAGAWNHHRSGDVDVLETLTGASQQSLVEQLETVIRQPDPMFTRVGATWAVAAPEDSWRTARLSIRDADLRELERGVQTVLGAVDPRLELPPEDRWSAAIYGKTRVHSTDLRGGLARSLALLGSWGDEVRVAGGRSARQWAEGVVWKLVSRANEDASAQLWESMSDILPLLAEAAPDVFLRAVADATSGVEPLARNFFHDYTDAWQVSSPHTGLLWALESVAWSSRHLGFAAEVLAALAEIDPGGKLSNRPVGSLRGIFRPWLPQTAAPLDSRLLVIDALLHRHEEVAWELLLDLLPGPSEVAMPSQKPRFRDWADGADQETTYGEIRRFVDAISERIIDRAAEDPHRWSQVVGVFNRLPDDGRRSVLAGVAELKRGELEPAGVRQLWDAIDGFIRRNRRFPDSGWSLSEDWLALLEAAAAELAPSTPTERFRWLFDDWMPDLGMSTGDDYAAYHREIERAREDGIKRIIDAQGFAAARQFASEVALPSAVGFAAARVDQEHDADALNDLDSADANRAAFADAFARARFGGRMEELAPWIDALEGRPLAQARLLQTSENVKLAWETVSERGGALDAAYWQEFVPYGRGADFPHANEAARQLLLHDRAAMAVHTLSLFAERLESDLEVQLVLDALTQFGAGDQDAARVSEHDLTRLLAGLRSRGVDETEIARLEWKFLPALNYEDDAPSLQQLLAKDPQVFVQLVGLVFRSTGSDSDEEREVDSTIASNAFRLLKAWRVVPGTTSDGAIDSDVLQEWIKTARAGLEEQERLEVGELQIGEVLAHAPTDPDGTFPARAVRDLLEGAPNDRLERGFVIGLHNMRGVTSRGMTEGGQQEFDLAKDYDARAERIEATHPRTAGALRQVAESYRQEGRRNDEEARRFLEGLEY
ncbi:hypothetical protein [Agromyces silvae]|uniref:hypothetical protein n=1 Tax=Agromyces silvae TaxID=3388266 RepID=UPI00280B40FE|nr:hypothetical protein [Agromyces protaetiae]